MRPFALGRGRRMPTFFHGSTVVRTSVHGGYFIKTSSYLFFDPRFGCGNQKHGYARSTVNVDSCRISVEKQAQAAGLAVRVFSR
jgi:hypothetical protein